MHPSIPVRRVKKGTKPTYDFARLQVGGWLLPAPTSRSSLPGRLRPWGELTGYAGAAQRATIRPKQKLREIAEKFPAAGGRNDATSPRPWG
ncbi:hypothetical protein [Lacipirellula sp.]|uniref:hypothetical protein n=1 Tax=Lacipirellula sp. TaxID=2691419 RepID=UPI003D0EE774